MYYCTTMHNELGNDSRVSGRFVTARLLIIFIVYFAKDAADIRANTNTNTYQSKKTKKHTNVEI